MNIGFSLVTLFPGRVGGSETYVRGLLSQFASDAWPGRVTVLANRHVMASYGGYASASVALHEIASYRASERFLSRALAVAFARLAPSRLSAEVPPLDLLHYPVTVPVPEVALPKIVTLHDVQHHEHPEFFSRTERAWRRWAYDDAARKADLVITVSASAQAQIIDRLGISAQHVLVIPHGIDHARFTPAQNDVDARLDLPERFIVYPANLWPHKNHARLLRAFATVAEPDLNLVLVGQTYGRNLPGRPDNRVRHLGHVAPNVLPALYRRAQALVFPSLIEGFGFPPIEAMACGCPVAASNIAPVAELCGGAALLFDPYSEDAIADAIRAITRDAAARGRLRNEGLSRSKRYTWAQSARAHADAYGEILRRF